MNRWLSRLSLLALAGLLTGGCYGYPPVDLDPSEESGALTVYLDSRDHESLERLTLEISDVEVHLDEGNDGARDEWIDVAEHVRFLNLVERVPGENLLFSDLLPPGTYDEIAVEVNGASYVDEAGERRFLEGGDLFEDEAMIVDFGFDIEPNFESIVVVDPGLVIEESGPFDWNFRFELDATER